MLRKALLVSIGLVAACSGGGGGGTQAAPEVAAPETPWAPEWAALADAKIRPGVRMTPIECTTAFLFVDPVRHLYYLSTADHCTFGPGEAIDGTGSRIGIEGVGEVGTVVLDNRSEDSGGTRSDFALILLDAGMNLIAHPRVYGLDGPAVVASGPMDFSTCGSVTTGETFAWHGYAMYVDTAGEPARARQGTVNYCLDRSLYGSGPSYKGDSGSAALVKDTGEALGVLVSLSSAGGIEITPMDEIFKLLSAKGFGDLELATIDGKSVRP